MLAVFSCYLSVCTRLFSLDELSAISYPLTSPRTAGNVLQMTGMNPNAVCPFRASTGKHSEVGRPPVLLSWMLRIHTLRRLCHACLNHTLEISVLTTGA